MRARVFDVFGTLVDWRSGIAREAHCVLAAHGKSIDGEAFADAWRALRPLAELRALGRPARRLFAE
jgi:FMN phosphatase YigB (HAD superfamily)